ncbi:MAG TPA: TIM barrel protein, partial [Tepidisphaeraceae bacterium]|nr:TIM barrel protein [Tepidisphaeraceae bacterium]
GTIVWLHIGGQGPGFDTLKSDDATVSSLRGVSEIAAANDLRVAIYPHLGEWTAHFADATRLAELVNHPNFGVTFNLCHALAVGDEAKIPALLESAKRLLFTATICGADAGVTGGHWDRLIQPLGSGSFDVTSVLSKLRQIGFRGPIGFQGFGIKSDARSILAPTMAAWQKMSAAASE